MPLQAERDRQHPRGEFTRGQVLDAALRLFARDGYDATSVRTIGRECGLSDAALYHYFKSKREILDAIYQEQWKVATADRVAELPPGPMTAERLLQIADVTVEAIAQQDDLIRLVNCQALCDDRAAQVLRAQRVAAWRASLERQFAVDFDATAVASLVDTFTWLILGMVVTVHVDHPGGLVEAVRSPLFRAQLHAAVRRAVPFERYAGR